MAWVSDEDMSTGAWIAAGNEATAGPPDASNDDRVGAVRFVIRAGANRTAEARTLRKYGYRAKYFWRRLEGLLGVVRTDPAAKPVRGQTLRTVAAGTAPVPPQDEAMKPDEPVATLMSPAPLVVTADQKPSEVRKLLHEHGIHHVPVVDGKRFIGLITTNDLLRVSFGDTYKQDERMVDALLDTMTTRQVMQEDILTIQKGEPVRRAAELLADGSFHSLPVLDGEELVGVVTSTDLIRELLELYASR